MPNCRNITSATDSGRRTEVVPSPDLSRLPRYRTEGIEPSRASDGEYLPEGFPWPPVPAVRGSHGIVEIVGQAEMQGASS